MLKYPLFLTLIFSISLQASRPASDPNNLAASAMASVASSAEVSGMTQEQKNEQFFHALKQYSQDQRDDSKIKYWLAQGAQVDRKYIYESLHPSSVSKIPLLLLHDINPKMLPGNKFTIKHSVCSIKVFKSLAANRRFSLNLANEKDPNDTVMRSAIDISNINVVLLLRYLGADVTKKDIDGKTDLDYAGSQLEERRYLRSRENPGDPDIPSFDQAIAAKERVVIILQTPQDRVREICTAQQLTEFSQIKQVRELSEKKELTRNYGTMNTLLFLSRRSTTIPNIPNRDMNAPLAMHQHRMRQLHFAQLPPASSSLPSSSSSLSSSSSSSLQSMSETKSDN